MVFMGLFEAPPLIKAQVHCHFTLGVGAPPHSSSVPTKASSLQADGRPGAAQHPPPPTQQCPTNSKTSGPLTRLTAGCTEWPILPHPGRIPRAPITVARPVTRWRLCQRHWHQSTPRAANRYSLSSPALDSLPCFAAVLFRGFCSGCYL